MRTFIIQILMALLFCILIGIAHVHYTGRSHTDMEHPPVIDTIEYYSNPLPGYGLYDTAAYKAALKRVLDTMAARGYHPDSIIIMSPQTMIRP